MTNRRGLLSLLVVGLVAAGCGDSDGSAGAPTTTAQDGGAYGAQVASYDLAADGPQRFLVGLIGADNGLIVGGEVTLEFRYFGLDASETAGAADGELLVSDVSARFTPVAGGIAPPDGEGPRVKEGKEGVGVYEATGVEFDEPGFWSVTVQGEVGGAPIKVSAAFEVAAKHRIVAAGEPAPRTVNLLPGDPGAPPKAVDSRAEDDGSVPDPELHELTVVDAIGTRLPTVVVISTPVFCVSRFCGPITDSIQALAGVYDGQANFVHIEVWKDFEGNALNKGAAEWIYPNDQVDPFEPWVFLVDGEGVVVQRWDNVANVDDVEAALAAAIG
jgi:hypothetical protein